jgi:APA family basic amino acid/polyamine antiporter
VGIILGAGIYALIGPASGLAGNSLWISFIIGAIVSSFTGLSYIELSTMFPKAAAEYVYAKKAFGRELWAFLLGWLIIFAGAVAASAVAIGFAGYLRSFIAAPIIVIALLLILGLSLTNFLGIQESSRMNIAFTAVEISGIVLIIVLGLGQIENTSINYFEAPLGIQGILAASALVFFAYLGFEDIVNIAEEMKEPRKNIPKALILSILITTIFYVLLAVSVVNLADWNMLAASEAPLAYAASQVLGSNAFVGLSIIALFATANTVLILLIVGSRMIFGMSRGGALPKFLSKVHGGRGTPWMAIIVVMMASIFFIFLRDLELVAGITNFATFTIFSSVNIALIWLRYRQPELERPFKVPLNIGKFPVIPFLGLISSIFLAYHLEPISVFVSILVLLIGGIIFKIWTSIR